MTVSDIIVVVVLGLFSLLFIVDFILSYFLDKQQYINEAKLDRILSAVDKLMDDRIFPDLTESNPHDGELNSED